METQGLKEGDLIGQTEDPLQSPALGFLAGSFNQHPPEAQSLGCLGHGQGFDLSELVVDQMQGGARLDTGMVINCHQEVTQVFIDVAQVASQQQVASSKEAQQFVDGRCIGEHSRTYGDAHASEPGEGGRGIAALFGQDLLETLQQDAQVLAALFQGLQGRRIGA